MFFQRRHVLRSYKVREVLFGCFFYNLLTLHQLLHNQIYPGCYHKLLNEIKEDADAVKKDIVEWILARIP